MQHAGEGGRAEPELRQRGAAHRTWEPGDLPDGAAASSVALAFSLLGRETKAADDDVSRVRPRGVRSPLQSGSRAERRARGRHRPATGGGAAAATERTARAGVAAAARSDGI